MAECARWGFLILSITPHVGWLWCFSTADTNWGFPQRHRISSKTVTRSDIEVYSVCPHSGSPRGENMAIYARTVASAARYDSYNTSFNHVITLQALHLQQEISRSDGASGL